MIEFRSKAIAEHVEVPLADDGRWEDLVAAWDERRQPHGGESACYVASVGPDRDPWARSAQLDEIVKLVESQGGRIVGQEICRLAEPHPRTLLGRGTAEELAARARASGATMLVLDAELTPSQTRNLEDLAKIPICDREAIILNVFLRHARTRRARIQVEIAQLEYLRPRIRGMGLDMDQQVGGMGPARGPGETASELFARKLDRRLEELRKALRKVERSAKTQRRQREACKRIVLVGYTNAGKTSLMNALTGAQLSARDMPFETLDTTSRALTRHGGDVLVSDTVGFIRRLPERLFASFASTLTEIAEASLVVIVLDVSDQERELQLRTTLEMLERLDATHVPRFYAFNKVDQLPSWPKPEELDAWSGGHPWALLSALDEHAVAELAASLLRTARATDEALTTFLPYEARDLLALAYAKCRVLDTEATRDGLKLQLEGPADVVARLRSGRTA